MNMFRHACLAALMLAAAAPALGQDAAFPGVLDRPYAGRATFEVFPTGGGARLQNDTGTAQATITREGESLRLTASGETEANGGLTIEILLEDTGDGNWRGTTPNGMSEITLEGRILSIGVSDGYLTTLSGQIDDENLAFSLRRSPTAAAADAPDADFEMVFSFDLVQPDAATQAEPERQQTSNTSDCARIVTQTRNIANPFGGAMSMIMVPVCVPG